MQLVYWRCIFKEAAVGGGHAGAIHISFKFPGMER